MLKRNVTPSFPHRMGNIPHPKTHKNSKESNKLILPILKKNFDEKSLKSDISKNNLCSKKNSSKENRKKILNINNSKKNILSPINTELNKQKKRGSYAYDENHPKYSKFILNIKEKSTNQIKKIKKINSKDKDINKNNKKKNLNNIATEILPLLYNNKNNKNIKYPLIETNIYPIKSGKKEDNKLIHKAYHKYKSDDNLLDTEYIFKLKKDSTYSKKGTEEGGKPKENNQDMSIILKNVCNVENYNIYGIMDGHGSNGHLVSNFVKEKIEEYFKDKKIYKSKKIMKAVSSIQLDISDTIFEKLINNNYEIIRNFYKKVNDELYNTKFDVHFSGTTCVLVFKIGQKIICSNVGDSRAILVKRKINLNNKDNNIKYEYIELSHDHKPNNKEEKERIEKSGGEVSQAYLIGKEEEGPTGPFRVWCKECDYPGIAISRSLGDKIAELIGVIAEPDILEFDIDENCKYIIMGSDGLFDYLSDNEIMNIAEPFLIRNNPDKACINVVEKASQLFKEKEERIDDITINIITL